MNERDGSAPLFLALLLWLVSLLIPLPCLSLAWILKDGLGPDAVESYGLVALGRFWRGLSWVPFLVSALTFASGCLFYRWDACRRSAQYHPKSGSSHQNHRQPIGPSVDRSGARDL
jgi:hypothetical protein